MLPHTCFTDTDQILLAQHKCSQKERWGKHYYCVRCVQCYLVKHSCVHFSLTGNFTQANGKQKCHKANILILTVSLTFYVTIVVLPLKEWKYCVLNLLYCIIFCAKKCFEIFTFWSPKYKPECPYNINIPIQKAVFQIFWSLLKNVDAQQDQEESEMRYKTERCGEITILPCCCPI